MTNFSHCYHKKVTNTIFDLVYLTWILTLTIVINYFHFSFHFHGLDIEKMEFGLIVVFFLLRKIKLWILLLVTLITPFLDHILHGHFFPLAPFEAFFNFLIFLVVVISARFFLTNKVSFFRQMVFLAFTIVIIIFLKALYFAVIFFIFINPINFFQLLSWEFDLASSKQWLLFLIFLAIVVVKFSFMLYFVLFSHKNNWLKG